MLTLGSSPSAANALTEKASASDPGVKVDAGNSQEITGSRQGGRDLQSFAERVRGQVPELRAMNAETLGSKYQVLEVDVEKMLPTPGCKRGKETLILPEDVTEIRYIPGSIDSKETAKPCSYTVIWDDPAPNQKTQDDPSAQPSGFSAQAEPPYAENYASYCAARHPGTGANTSWVDACYRYWVEKYDGNASWNYYSAHVWSTCGVSVDSYLTSCGRGVMLASDSPTGYWLDWAPSGGSPPGCRTIDNGITLWNVGVSSSYTSCEEQLVYKYTEPGKMSTYWKGEVPDNQTRGTRHQTAVRVGQNDGRPTWSNWFNSEGYYCGGLGLPFCL